MKLFYLWIGLTIANFIYAAATTHDWSEAVDRSVFQGFALMMAARY